MIKAAKKYHNLAIFVIAISLIIPVTSSFYLLVNPLKAKIASSDSNQYINSWPAGYGVREISEIITKEAENKKVYIGTEGTFGLLPYALRIYFFKNENVQFIGYWPVNAEKLPDQILELAEEYKTYFVFNENQAKINNAQLNLIERYKKGNGDTYMRLYEVAL